MLLIWFIFLDATNFQHFFNMSSCTLKTPAGHYVAELFFTFLHSNPTYWPAQLHQIGG